jgi:hypothetical protein
MNYFIFAMYLQIQINKLILKNMDKQFTEQDSLRLINEMIVRARSNFKRSRLTIVLFWGYCIAILAIGNFILLQVLAKPSQSFNVWWLSLVGFIVSFFIQRRIDRTAIVKTHIDFIIKYIWWGYGISVMVLYSVLSIMSLQGRVQFIYITSVIMIMCGLAQFSTAIACRYKPYYWGACIFWLGAIACAIVTAYLEKVDYQFLILAASMIAGFIIPNHILNNKKHV